MATCTKCGAALAEGTSFCGACGQAVGSMGGAAAPTQSTNMGVGSQSAGTGLTMNLAAALSYALGAITGILFLVLEPYKNDRFVRFHAMQSILYCVACVILAIAWNIVWGTLASILGFWVLAVDVPLRLLVSLGIFVFWLYLMFQAYSQREYRIPWIGEIAAKQVH
jgi:uncharacterized membrane protein